MAQTTMQSALEREEIRLVSEEGAVRQLWKDAPKNCEVVAPGPNGKWGYLFKVKDDLKKNGFRFNPDQKLWYRTPLAAEEKTGIEAFDLGGVVPKVSSRQIVRERIVDIGEKNNQRGRKC